MILITGCGNKTLKCNRDNSYSDEMKMYQELELKFKSDSVSKLSMNMSVELGEEYLDFKDSLLQSVESEFADFSDEKGLSYSSSNNDSGFDFKLKINFNKLSDSAKNNIDIVNYESSYESVKADLEESGYSCK